VARALPPRVADGLSGIAGSATAVFAREQRAQVERNLRRVHGPGFDRRALRREVRATFTSYGRYWAESFRLPGTTPEALEAGIEVKGFTHVEAARDTGRGAILALPHLGAWEFGGFWLAHARQVPVTVVVEALDPPELFEWFADLRRSFGMNVVALGPDAGTQVVRALKANHVACLLSDRDLGGGGVEVEFFGERTTLPGGPATLALRTGAALLPAAVYFGGRRGHEGIVEPPIPAEREGGLRADVVRIT
jgi:KDO2-lipid IV(A) lauroyltransferase